MMKKMHLSLILVGLLSTASLHLQAAENCKASMMGRICYNDDGSLRGESTIIDKKSAPADADKLAEGDGKKIVTK